MADNKFELAPLLAKLPGLNGGKMPPVDPDLTNDLGHDLIDGEAAAITALVTNLNEVDDGSDWKSRFLLNALAIHVGTPGHAPQQQAFIDACLAELERDYPPAVKTFVLTQLRLVAGRATVPKLVPLLAADNPQLADAAVAVLVSIGEPAKAALNEALSSARERQQEIIRNALAQIP